jgi:hypothetical protein
MDSQTEGACQGLINRLKSVITSEGFKARHRQRVQDFTRQRCLPFVIVVLFLLNSLKRAAQDELDEFFKMLNGDDIAARIVTKSAFFQARKKLKYEAFIKLNEEQVQYFYAHFGPATWHGFRLVAVDGSMSELPDTSEIREHFGVWHPAAGGECPKARVSQMFDVLNRVTLHAIIVPKEVGERAAAEVHFAHLTVRDLALLDQGYPAFWLFAFIRSKDAHFCARMPLEGWKVVDRFVASGRREQIVTMSPGYEARKACQVRGLPTTPVTLRLLRIELDNGDVEVLATSLVDRQLYPYAVFKDLYHHRWPVEEDYKAMKSRLEVENWSGKSVLAVYQDFHAKVFTKNLTAILTQPAQKVVEQQSQDKRYTYQINMTNAFSKMKDTMVLLFQRADIRPLLNRLWQLMIKTIEPIRPGRSYPRKKRVKRKRFPMCYKPIR